MQARGDRASSRGAQLHGMWAGVAGAWGEHAAYVDARGAARHGADARARAAPARASACSSWPAAPAARARRRPRASAPGGEVVLSDVVARDDGDRRRRAPRRSGSTNVTHARARPRDDRRARRLLRRRALPRGADVRARPGRAAARDPRACCGRAGGSRSRSGDRASATRGSASCSTRSARRLGAPVPPPASRARSRSTTPTRWPRLLSGAGLSDVGVEEFPVPLRAGLVRRVVDPSMRAGRPAGQGAGGVPEEAQRRSATARGRR